MTAGAAETLKRCRKVVLTDPEDSLKQTYLVGQLAGGRRDEADEAFLAGVLSSLCRPRSGACRAPVGRLS